MKTLTLIKSHYIFGLGEVYFAYVYLTGIAIKAKMVIKGLSTYVLALLPLHFIFLIHLRLIHLSFE
jgi:hypothetical protein